MQSYFLTAMFISGMGVGLPQVGSSSSQLAVPTQAVHFETLKSLVGTYKESGDPEKAYTVTYKLISRDNAITEMWTSPTGREELTVFHMNNGTLAATHYCASGVQSTMKLSERSKSGVLDFRLTSVSNLTDADKAHVSGFSYSFKDKTRIERSETWSKSGKNSQSATTLIRQGE